MLWKRNEHVCLWSVYSNVDTDELCGKSSHFSLLVLLGGSLWWLWQDTWGRIWGSSEPSGDIFQKWLRKPWDPSRNLKTDNGSDKEWSTLTKTEALRATNIWSFLNKQYDIKESLQTAWRLSRGFCLRYLLFLFFLFSNYILLEMYYIVLYTVNMGDLCIINQLYKKFWGQ